MDQLQKKFILRTSILLLLTIILAAALVWSGGQQTKTIFYYMIVVQEIPGAFLLIALLLGGIYLAKKMPDSWPDRILAFVGKHPLWLSFLAFFLLTMGAYFVYHRHPLSMDEFMQVFQAKIFASGKLWGQYPPALIPWLAPSHYYATLSAETGRVIADYWPGFALMLTPFMKIGIPWMLNPLVSAATLFLLFRYAKQIMPDSHAPSWAVILTLASSVFLANGISYFTMSAHLLLNLAFAMLLLELSARRLFLAGLVGSLALVLHNPVPHFAFAVPWILWIALKPNRSRNLAFLFAGYLPISLILGVGWMWLKVFVAQSGALAISGAPAGSSNGLIGAIYGFAERFSDNISAAFSLPGWPVLQSRAYGILKIFAWCIPGLPILAILGSRRLKSSPHLALWGWSAVSTLVIYFFVPFDGGHGWGFRYFHSAWLALPLLATAFLTDPGLKAALSWKKYVCTLCLLSLLFCTAQRFTQIQSHIEHHLSQLPTLQNDKNYLCILKVRHLSMGHDLIQNNPFLLDRVIYLETVNEAADQAMVSALFPTARNVQRTPLYVVWEIPDTANSIEEAPLIR